MLKSGRPVVLQTEKYQTQTGYCAFGTRFIKQRFIEQNSESGCKSACTEEAPKNVSQYDEWLLIWRQVWQLHGRHVSLLVEKLPKGRPPNQGIEHEIELEERAGPVSRHELCNVMTCVLMAHVHILNCITYTYHLCTFAAETEVQYSIDLRSCLHVGGAVNAMPKHQMLFLGQSVSDLSDGPTRVVYPTTIIEYVPFSLR